MKFTDRLNWKDSSEPHQRGATVLGVNPWGKERDMRPLWMQHATMCQECRKEIGRASGVGRQRHTLDAQMAQQGRHGGKMHCETLVYRHWG